MMLCNPLKPELYVSIDIEEDRYAISSYIIEIKNVFRLNFGIYF